MCQAFLLSGREVFRVCSFDEGGKKGRPLLIFWASAKYQRYRRVGPANLERCSGGTKCCGQHKVFAKTLTSDYREPRDGSQTWILVRNKGTLVRKESWSRSRIQHREHSSVRSSVLSEPALVLNKSWIPTRVCSTRRALLLLYKDHARAIGDNYILHDFPSWADLEVTDGQSFVQAVSLRIRTPEVVVLRNCDRFMQPRVVFSRRNVFRRDHHTCQYCGKRGSSDQLSIDHVVPRSRGGIESWTNCVVACRCCNEHKGNRGLQQAGMELLRSPKEPPAHMAFTLQLGRRKPSWEQFVTSSSWRAAREA